MGKDSKGELLATRETNVGRIRLALGVFRGLMDLHEGVGIDSSTKEWLPIVHADLQAKQYLVDAVTGQVYLNDFNRCRFLAKRVDPVNNYMVASSNTTANSSSASSRTNSPTIQLERCPLYIATSPGASRSPEEYDMASLTEKLDVYSAGNILYGIITGNRPWNDERGRNIKNAIQFGQRPEVEEAIRNGEMGEVNRFY